MADYVLHDGTEVSFDLYQLKRSEYVRLSNGDMEDPEVYEVMARVTGLAPEIFEEMSWPDWQVLFTEFHRKARAPINEANDEKNSASGSTSE